MLSKQLMLNKKVVALSTDKACAVNLYGATKLCSDKLFIAANNYAGKKIIFFSSEIWKCDEFKRISIAIIYETKRSRLFYYCSQEMTRFNITLEESVEFVLKFI